MKINIYILLIILLSALSLNAQLSTYEKPPSYSMKSELLKYDDKNIKVMPPIDLAKLLEEDKEEESHGLPPRFGFKHKVSLNTENSGQWYKLDDGRRMWRLKISCPGAKSINLLYDKFWLPEGGKFFIYSADKRQCIGAFTTINNKGDRKEPRGFATELVVGEESVLEYYTPKEQTEEAIISIDCVVHGYKKLAILNKYYTKDENEFQCRPSVEVPGTCHVNINCSPEGDDWQNEKNAIATFVDCARYGPTGFLINNTRNDFTPYFMTAKHCIGSKDAIGNAEATSLIFYWKYEYPDCSSSDYNENYTRYSTNGAIVVANDVRIDKDVTDFALLKLIEDPKYIPNFEPYYLGWDRTGTEILGGVVIHHPNGGAKKIATYNIHNFTSQCDSVTRNTFWEIAFIATRNGHSVLENRSSGSPLINSQHRVIGEAVMHNPCIRPFNECNQPSTQRMIFGKFSVAWTGNNNNDIRRRLDHWLDPDNTGLELLDGIGYCRENNINYNINTDKTIKCEKVIFNNSTINNDAKVTIHSKKLIIENDFKLESGKRFEVNLSPQ